jgi:hypothetical protein
MNAAMSRIAKVDLPIFGLAVLLLLPAILSPPMTRDSFWIDWVWSNQFTAELAKGHFYPRWFPLANGGAGSATFYFYPPIAFYVSGLLGLLGLSTFASVIGCFALGLILSGYTMFAWLRGRAHPLLGSLLFMAAPYHIYDFYGRGAQAEFLAIGLVPLVALGLRRASEKRPTLLAFAYGGLILTHLPLALLASLFLIAPYCLWHGELRRYAAPLVLGIAIAAIYLVPALVLDKYRHSELLWADPSYQAKNWSLLFWHEGPVRGMRNLFAVILASFLIPTIVLWFAGQKKAALYAAACCIVAAGIIPGLWALPLLRDVQFPFRMLPLVEFAIATGIASATLSGRMLALGASPALVLTPVFTFYHPDPQHGVTMAELAATHPDVPENRLNGRGPLPAWPEQVGLLISLVGISLTAAMHFRGRRTAGCQSPICSRTT